MRILVLFVVALFALLIVAPPGAADERYRPFQMIEPVTDPVYQQMGPACGALLKELRAAGVLANHSSYEQKRYEEDYWATNPQCAELRDEVQWKQDAYGALGTHEKCIFTPTYGCVHVNHPYCDFAFHIHGSLILWCWGGLSPKN